MLIRPLDLETAVLSCCSGTSDHSIMPACDTVGVHFVAGLQHGQSVHPLAHMPGKVQGWLWWTQSVESRADVVSRAALLQTAKYVVYPTEKHS